MSWKHWLCLFPQHGAGRKHERPIVLAPWQRDVVEQHPADLLRGLFHSDGCRTTNRVRRADADGATRIYTYPRWQLTHACDDIMAICTAALDLVGIGWTRSGRTLSVSRRTAVATLDRLIGEKA